MEVGHKLETIREGDKFFKMNKFFFLIILLFLKIQGQNAPSFPVTDKYFGTNIVDPYRNLEDLQDLKTVSWMKLQ
ncbi:hypothetical protein, partial [Paraburkholderia sp. SIMBA_030]|uniref:hypothetical protein n=1 Tax=Paraburkholderia sp. SIMBA_030 TaxID=3085773 RepID=UPI003979CE87